ncbi:type II secretion system protein [Filobacillus milosensis]|uniref:Type II secretion system protein n=1 Tax=Filobacillus milosensis TaxID=94137 RepID=A0A4Y8IK02_9BACI|nr:prepilin-type N-terminal cleavage/methylation domain-containing protein [Filobacillus milosensis]TFB13899.1 type II secretion system protein [Filobacillus milosensis]
MCEQLIKHEKGMTLIEILGALVILSIVLIGFFSVFTQSASMQNVNEEEMLTTNLIRSALEDVRELDSSSVSPGTYTNFDLLDIASVNNQGQFYSQPSYYLKLIITDESDTNLLKAKLQVIDQNGKVYTDTYDYIEVSP